MQTYFSWPIEKLFNPARKHLRKRFASIRLAPGASDCRKTRDFFQQNRGVLAAALLAQAGRADSFLAGRQLGCGTSRDKRQQEQFKGIHDIKKKNAGINISMGSLCALRTLKCQPHFMQNLSASGILA